MPHVLRLYAVRYTAEVATELPETFASGREFWRLVRAGELAEVLPGQDQVGMFGLGERSAINIALQHRDWVLLLDDWRPLLYAASVGLRVVFTPVLIVQLYQDGAVSEVEALRHLDELTSQRTLSPALIELARSQLLRQ